MSISRRQFLKASMAAGAGLAFPAIIRADSTWAPLPQSVGDLPKYKILEVFCHGGLSQWENFWVSHDASGSPSESDSNRNWRGLESFVENLNWLPANGGPAHATETRGFDYDGNGTPISWGPATAPLWRDDIMDRTRMIVTQHNDEVHSIAGFRTLTGRRFGSPRGASLGTVIQRHFQSVDPDQDIPFSYVLAPEHLGKSYWISHATALGLHPGTARPLALKVGSPIGNLLERDGISPAADRIFNELRTQYRDLLRFHGTGDPVRSAAFASYDAASDYLVRSDALDALLGGDTLEAGETPPSVHTSGRGPYGPHSNPTHRSLEVAAKLLNNGARHVTVFDGGLFDDDTKAFLRDSATPYDVHTGRQDMDCVEMTTVHLFNLLQGLASIIGSPGQQSLALPFASASSGHMISLDDTLILLHTEFNRTPSPGTNVADGGFAYAGRNHYGQATVALAIGGPVTSRGIQGGIRLENQDPTTAEATDALSTTDVIAAAMLAGGVNPVHPDNFVVTDGFSAEVNPGGEAGYATEIRTRLKQKVFGLGGSVGSTFKFG